MLRDTASMTKADNVSPGPSTPSASARSCSDTRSGGIVRDLTPVITASICIALAMQSNVKQPEVQDRRVSGAALRALGQVAAPEGVLAELSPLLVSADDSRVRA